MPNKRTSQNGSSADSGLTVAIRDRIRNLRQQLEQKTAESQNQRRSLRRPFACKQRIAPYASPLPDPSTFREVMCRDISTSGFSFLSTTDPEFTELIIELGVPPNSIYVVARVARVSQLPDNGGLVVGCQFTGRHA